jgi:hypothetical protein
MINVMPDKKYRQNPVIAWREIDSEAVLVDPRNGRIRVLNRTGSVVWSFCEEARAEADIAEHLAGKFEITSKEALGDVRDFIEECLQKDLIHIDNE